MVAYVLIDAEITVRSPIVMLPSARPAVDVTILKVDPGSGLLLGRVIVLRECLSSCRR